MKERVKVEDRSFESKILRFSGLLLAVFFTTVMPVIPTLTNSTEWLIKINCFIVGNLGFFFSMLVVLNKIEYFNRPLWFALGKIFVKLICIYTILFWKIHVLLDKKQITPVFIVIFLAGCFLIYNSSKKKET